MTGMNPNVFYEVGYAHALNKRVILLTETAEDIPFDLKHTPHVVYAWPRELQGQLERESAGAWKSRVATLLGGLEP